MNVLSKMYGSLEGYKTVVTGVLCIITAAALWAGINLPEAFQISGSPWELFLFGTGLLGIGGKLERSKRSR